MVENLPANAKDAGDVGSVPPLESQTQLNMHTHTHTHTHLSIYNAQCQQALGCQSDTNHSPFPSCVYKLFKETEHSFVYSVSTE